MATIMASYQKLEVGQVYRGYTDHHDRDRKRGRVLILGEATEKDYRDCLLAQGYIGYRPFIGTTYFYEVQKL